MKYEKTQAGNAPYLVENGKAYFSIREGVDQYLNIVTHEDDYRLDNGVNADMMIKMKVSLPN